MSSPSLDLSHALVRTMQQVLLLHGSFSTFDFCNRLQEVLAAALDRKDFTLVARDGEHGLVLHSTRIPNLRNRLLPPRFALGSCREFLDGPAPGEGAGTNHGRGLIEIEDEAYPVVEVWQLGVGTPNRAYLIFHTVDQEDSTSDERAVAEEVRRNASVAYFKICDQERFQLRLDHNQAKLEAINEIGELLGSLDLEVLLTKLLELSLYVVGGQVGSIILDGEEGPECPVEWGFPMAMADCFRDQEDRIVYRRVISEGKGISIQELGGSSGFVVKDLDVQVGSYFCVPVRSKNRTLGALNLIDPTEQVSFSELDREIVTTICGLAATSIENALLYQDSLEKERYQQSLEIARSIQRGLYPAKAPDVAWLDIAWRSESCDETGGDYFDFIRGAADELVLVVGDVSGHGIGAALHMASARAGLRATLARGVGLSELLVGLNQQLEEDMEIDQFMTMFVTKLASSEASVEFVNAGHDAPCLYRSSTNSVEELSSTGIPLGLFPGMRYETGTAGAMVSGDVLLVMTDGVWEVSDARGEMLGKERLKQIFLQNIHETAEEIATGILSDVNRYTGGKPLRDDSTLVVFRAR